MKKASFIVAAFLSVVLPLPAIAADDGADPARLAVARPVVEKLFPAGTYRRVMGQSMSRMMDGMMGSVMRAPIADLARIGGVPVEEVAGMDGATLDELSAIIDPAFRQRTQLGMEAMTGGMTDLMDGFEPRVRDALTRAYARNFTAAQLGELNAFFSTPTGGQYAAQSMSIFMDPEIVKEMQALMPEIMRKMPELTRQAEQAIAALPPPRRLSDLSADERKRLAELLDVKEKDLKDEPVGGFYGNDNDDAAVDSAVKEGTEQ